MHDSINDRALPDSKENLMRQQYSELKAKSSERQPFQPSSEPVNRFKRSKESAGFLEKYSQMEENFRKISQKEVRPDPEPKVRPQAVIEQPVRLTGFKRDSMGTVDKTYPQLLQYQVLHFCETLTTSLKNICVSQDQENQIGNLLLGLSFSAEEPAALSTDISTFLDRVIPLFHSVTARVYQIESATFLNYKFKHVLTLFEQLATQFARVLANAHLPSLCTQIIEARQKAGFTFLNILLKKNQVKRTNRAVQKWHGKHGRKQKLYTVLSLLIANHRVRLVARGFKTWNLLSRGVGQNTKLSLLTKLMLSKNGLDSCLQTDFGLISTLQRAIRVEHQLDCDLLLVRESQVILIDSEADQLVEFAYEAIKNSVTFKYTDEVKTTPRLLAHQRFDERIDKPTSSCKIKTDLSLTVVPLTSEQQLIGVLRYFKPGKVPSETMRLLMELATEITPFLNRVQELREKATNMTAELEEHLESTQAFELEQKIQKTFLSLLSQKAQNKDQFIDLLSEHTESLVQSLFSDEGLKVRQIFLKQSDPTASLHRVVEVPLLRDRGMLIKKPKQPLAVEYLDYQKDALTQQISVQTPQVILVLHKNLGSPVPSMPRRTCLTQDEREKLNLLAKNLEPVLLQGLKIHTELAGFLHMQQEEIERAQVLEKAMLSLSLVFENFSNASSEEESMQLLQTSVLTILQAQKVPVLSVGVMVNESCLQGQGDRFVGYFRNEQASKWFWLPEHLDSSEMRFTCAQSHFNLFKKPFQSDQSLTLFSVQNLAVIAFATPPIAKDDLKQACLQLASELEFHLQNQQTQATLKLNFKHEQTDLRDKIGANILDVDFQQQLQEILVLPFTAKPCLQTLGEGLAQLTQKTVPISETVAIELYQDGYLSCPDILGEHLNSQEGPQLPSHFLEEPVVMSGERLIKIALKGQRLCLVMILEHLSQGAEEASLVKRHAVCYYQVLIQFAVRALDSLTQSLLPGRQEHLPRVLDRLQRLRENQVKAAFMGALRALTVNRVPIFTRLECFERVLKVRPMKVEGYLDKERLDFQRKQHVLGVLGQTFKHLNIKAIKLKKYWFDQYKLKVLEHMQDEQEQLFSLAKLQPTKRQRKAFQILAVTASRIKLRSALGRFAVKAHLFRRLKEPHNKAMASVLCLLQAFTRVRMRLGFHKMRGNAIEHCLRDFEGIGIRDRDFFGTLSREVIQNGPDMGHSDAKKFIEAQLTQVLEKAIVYLQQTLAPETLDVIVCALSRGGQKVRGYLFKKDGPDSEMVNRIGEEQVTQIVQENIECWSSSQLQDFNIDAGKDVVFCKFFSVSG